MPRPLYEYVYLNNLDYKESVTPFNRYYHKFLNHRKEIKKLKAHEKNFLFEWISLLREVNHEQSYDLKLIEEASEYNFNNLILRFFDNFDFDKPARDNLNCVIEPNVMKANKAYFEKYYKHWVNELETKKGLYLSIVYTETKRRLKDKSSINRKGQIDKTEYNCQIKKIYTISFFIYYQVKLFFDGLTEKYIILKVYDNNIIINIYSFVHILFRHYFPSLDDVNRDRSLNDPLPFLNTDYLPYSIKEFLNLYFNYDKKPINSSREFLLFSFKRDKYIIWLQYKFLKEINDFGFEFRTLYKCSGNIDLDKFEKYPEHKVDSNLSFYF